MVPTDWEMLKEALGVLMGIREKRGSTGLACACITLAWKNPVSREFVVVDLCSGSTGYPHDHRRDNCA
ncbi:hypothetical protein V6N12_040832 [Hibiscus sabdariffa]|uniref:Uncharacterized protein n=1 Tax=Hibiscus sabdariffa TaxID=183260 RepID=A0ABR2E5H0_9ROSI